MTDLVTVLKRFNRKERYWLLRTALGANSERLDGGFREQLENRLGIKIPANAWWAMDYHLDWLIGALHLLNGGTEDKARENRMVTGTQEDIDLVIAFDGTLILIEAKGDTPWSNPQLNSKVDRLEQIFAGGDFPGGLMLHFVLMSPKPSENLERAPTGDWPKWMCNSDGQPLHLKMTFGDVAARFLKVVRCNDEGCPDKAATHWKVCA